MLRGANARHRAACRVGRRLRLRVTAIAALDPRQQPHVARKPDLLDMVRRSSSKGANEPGRSV